MPILHRTLLNLRLQIISYGAGLFVWGAIVVLMFPSISAELAEIQYPEAMLELFGDGAANLGEYRSFMNMEYFQWVPIVLAIFGITFATNTLAGEEGRGSLETILMLPVSRTRLMAEKLAAMVIAMLLIVAIGGLGLAVTMPFVDLGENSSLGVSLAVLVGMMPVAIAIATFSLLLAAVAPSRGAAAALTAALFMAAWLANGLSEISDATSGLKYLSGFYYGDTQTLITSGAVLWHQLVLATVIVVQVALALVAFNRRDIEVRQWQFGTLLPGSGAIEAAASSEPLPADPSGHDAPVR